VGARRDGSGAREETAARDDGVRLLGPLELIADGVPVALGGRRRRTLFGVLLVHRGDVVSVDRLLDEVWHGAPPDRARDTLQAHLAHLRRSLADAGSSIVIERKPPGYALHVDEDDLDAGRFHALVDRAQRTFASGDASAAADAYGEALALWVGTALDGVEDAPSIVAERTSLEAARRDAIERWAEAELARGAPAAAIGPLEALLADDPWRERATADLMLALYRCGRQVDAIAVYERMRMTLADDLGLDPSPELRALVSDILRRTPEIDAPDPAASSSPREVLPFVGRDLELRVLGDAVDRAAGGERVVALVRGQAGAGKTRLVRELALSASTRNITVVVGRCDEEAIVPYQPFLEAIGGYVDRMSVDTLSSLPATQLADLARVVPRLADRIPAPVAVTTAAPGFERLRFFEAVTGFLRSIAPVVIVLDDVHCADQASLALLHHLLRPPTSEPERDGICVVLTAREAEAGTANALATVAEAQRDGVAVVHVSIAGLDGDAVGALVRSCLRGAAEDELRTLTAELLQATDGNAFFVRELLRDIGDHGASRTVATALPTTVRDAIDVRLARLGTDARESLAAAAVVGHEFDLDVLAAVVATPERDVLDHLEDATRIGVIVETPIVDRFRFAHALHRRVITDQLPASRRVRLHHLVGEAIEELRAGDLDEHLGELAHHFAEASKVSDASLAVSYSRRAGERAMRLLAYEEAAQHFRRAVDGMNFMSDPDDHLKCRLLLALGDAHNRAGDIATASTVLLEASALAGRLGDNVRLAESALLYGGAMTGPVDVDPQRIALLERALAASDGTNLALRARVLARLADALEYAPGNRALELSVQAVALARQSGDEAALASALYANVNLHFVDGSGGERLAEVTELSSLARSVGDVDLQLMAEAWRIVRLLELGDAVDADEALADMTEQTTQLRQPFYQWGAAGFHAMHALLRGDFTEAETLADRALAFGQRVHPGQALQSHVTQLVGIRWAQGRLDEIAGLVDMVDHTTTTLPGWQAVQVWVPYQVGDLDTARRRTDALADDDFGDIITGPFWSPCTALVGEACAAIGRPEHAQILYDRLLPLASEAIVVGRASVCLGAASRYLGLLAARLGRLDDAMRHFDHAVGFNMLLGARAYTAVTRYEYALALRSRGQSGDAERSAQFLREAKLGARTIDMSWLVARVEAIDEPAHV
jgi:DNA-binding SARP family transcriptional activator/tetratricopeptide (TPR) repeat protein